MDAPIFRKKRLDKIVSKENVDNLCEELLNHGFIDKEGLVTKKCFKIKNHSDFGIDPCYSNQYFSIQNYLKELWIWYEIEPFCIPLFFVNVVSNGYEFLRNATCSIHKKDKSIYIVTNSHVWKEYNKLKLTNPSLELGIGRGDKEDIYLVSKPIVLDQEDKVDLSTLVFEGIENYNLGKKKLIDNKISYTLAQNDDSACFLGYPEDQSYIVKDLSGVCAQSFNFTDFVTDVTDKQFILANNDNQREFYVESSRYNPNARLSGVSGSPVFLIKNGCFDISGVIYASNRDGHKSTFYVTHIHFIKNDGMIDRSAIRW